MKWRCARFSRTEERQNQAVERTGKPAAHLNRSATPSPYLRSKHTRVIMIANRRRWPVSCLLLACFFSWNCQDSTRAEERFSSFVACLWSEEFAGHGFTLKEARIYDADAVDLNNESGSYELKRIYGIMEALGAPTDPSFEVSIVLGIKDVLGTDKVVFALDSLSMASFDPEVRDFRGFDSLANNLVIGPYTGACKW